MFPSRRQSDLSTFLDDLSDLLKGPDAAAIRKQILRRVNAARSDVYSAYDNIREARDVATKRGRQVVDRGLGLSRDVVNERPLSAVAIAAAGGILLGLLLSLRR